MRATELEQHMNYLFSVALKKCGNFQDAEDLTSEVLLAAISYPKEFPMEHPVPPKVLVVED